MFIYSIYLFIYKGRGVFKIIMNNTKFNHDIQMTIFFHDSDYYSGATRSMLDLVEYWEKNDDLNLQFVFPSEGTAVDYCRKNYSNVLVKKYYQYRTKVNENTIRYLIAWPIRFLRYILSYLFTYFLFVKDFKDKKINIIYSNTSTIYTGYWISKALKIKHIWHIREFNQEDQNYNPFPSSKVFYRKLNKSSKIIFISNSLKNKYINEINNNNYKVIYDDLSPDYINPIERTYLKENEKINVLSCGSIIPGKGHLEVIKSVINLNFKGYNVFLKIAGKMNTLYSEVLLKYVEDYDIYKCIEFLGHVKDMAKLRKSCDISVIASNSEAFGRVTVESMLSKMAIVASNSGSNIELISHRRTGMLYKAHSIDSLSEMIIELYNDRRLLVKICENAFEEALKYTKGACAKKITKYIIK